MHELSIALRIVDIATEEARDKGAGSVSQIDIEVGSLSGVVIEALQMAMREAVRNSILEEAEVTIHEVPARSRCKNCEATFEVNDVFYICPYCNSPEQKLLQGQELRVSSLKVR